MKMMGAVGDDRYGQMFIVELTRNGVDASGIVTIPHTRSSVCFVIYARESMSVYTGCNGILEERSLPQERGPWERYYS